MAGLRKLLLPRSELHAATTALLDLPLVRVEPAHIREALRNEDRYEIPFWDALILAAAESGGVEVVYTEDLNDGSNMAE